MKVYRTPDARFAAIPDFDHPVHYVEVDALDDLDGVDTLRLAYVEAGPADGPVTLLLHGEPSWSFLWRHVVPPLVEAGHRVVAPDLIGFGRSDKPQALEDYSYARQERWLEQAVLERLNLSEITMVCHDWGGLLGFRLLAFHPERFARVVATNTGFPDGEHRLPDAWWAFHDFVQRTPDLPIGFLVQGRDRGRDGTGRGGGVRGAVPRTGGEGRRPCLPRSHPADAGGPGHAASARRVVAVGPLPGAAADRLLRCGPDHARQRPGAAGQDSRCDRPAACISRRRRALPAGGRGPRACRRGGGVSVAEGGVRSAAADRDDPLHRPHEQHRPP